MSTVATELSTVNSIYQQWRGYTFEASRQVLILLIYRYRVKSDAPPELIVRSDSEIPACLLMGLSSYFQALSADS